MPRKRSSNDLVLFSSTDPQPLVRWLCDTYGLQTVLQSVAQYQPSGGGAETTTKRAYKKRGPKKGSTKKASQKTAGKKRGRPKSSGNEAGNG